jgi:hypothetical protein
MITFFSSQSIYFELLYLKNKVPQSGKTIAYEVFNESGSIVQSGNLSEYSSSGIYHFTWAHSYTQLTRLRVRVKEGSDYFGEDLILILPDTSNNPYLTATIDAINTSDSYEARAI